MEFPIRISIRTTGQPSYGAFFANISNEPPTDVTDIVAGRGRTTVIRNGARIDRAVHRTGFIKRLFRLSGGRHIADGPGRFPIEKLRRIGAEWTPAPAWAYRSGTRS